MRNFVKSLNRYTGGSEWVGGGACVLSKICVFLSQQSCSLKWGKKPQHRTEPFAICNETDVLLICTVFQKTPNLIDSQRIQFDVSHNTTNTTSEHTIKKCEYYYYQVRRGLKEQLDSTHKHQGREVISVIIINHTQIHSYCVNTKEIIANRVNVLCFRERLIQLKVEMQFS